MTAAVATVILCPELAGYAWRFVRYRGCGLYSRLRRSARWLLDTDYDPNNPEITFALLYVTDDGEEGDRIYDIKTQMIELHSAIGTIETNLCVLCKALCGPVRELAHQFAKEEVAFRRSPVIMTDQEEVVAAGDGDGDGDGDSEDGSDDGDGSDDSSSVGGTRTYNLHIGYKQFTKDYEIVYSHTTPDAMAIRFPPYTNAEIDGVLRTGEGMIKRPRRVIAAAIAGVDVTEKVQRLSGPLSNFYRGLTTITTDAVISTPSPVKPSMIQGTSAELEVIDSKGTTSIFVMDDNEPITITV